MDGRLRILQVVTEISPGYGGPGSVAVEQSRWLASRGHEVTLISTRLGDSSSEESVDGVCRRVFPARQTKWPVQRIVNGPFATRVAPSLSSWIGGNVDRFDVAHVHFGRELALIGAVRQLQRAGKPIALQTHGMVEPAGGPRGLADALIIKRLLRASGMIFALQAHEVEALSRIESQTKVRILPNGLDVTSVLNLLKEEPTEEPDAPYILFAGRFHRRKRPTAFVEMAHEVVKQYPEMRFRMFGADDGERRATEELARRLGLSDVVSIEGEVSRPAVLAAMRGARAFVLPSREEPFAMAALEALAVGVPCVVTNTCHNAELLASANAVEVTSLDPRAIAESVSRILADPSLASFRVSQGRKLMSDELALDRVGEKLTEYYREMFEQAST